MHHFSLLQLNPDPETVNAERDDGQQEPLDPVSEQADCCSVKMQSVPIDDRMLDLPVVDHRIRPGQADAQGQRRYESSEQTVSDQLEQAAIKIGFSHFLIPPPFHNPVHSNDGIIRYNLQVSKTRILSRF